MSAPTSWPKERGGGSHSASPDAFTASGDSSGWGEQGTERVTASPPKTSRVGSCLVQTTCKIKMQGGGEEVLKETRGRRAGKIPGDCAGAPDSF